MRQALSLWVFSLALLIPSFVNADFSGRVVSIADGDTLTVLVERQQVKIRLVEIDAPEKAQAFGNRATGTSQDFKGDALNSI